MKKRKWPGLILGAGILLLLAGCMKDKPETLPQALEWNPELAFPLGNSDYGMNAESGFDTTLFEIDSLTNLPAWLDEAQLMMIGRHALDFEPVGPALEKAERLLFRIRIENSFPHEALTQAYFYATAGGEAIDSLFAEGEVALPPAEFIGGEHITRASITIRDVVYDREGIDAILAASEVVLYSRITNHAVDTSYVDAYRQYTIRVETGVMAQMNYDY